MNGICTWRTPSCLHRRKSKKNSIWHAKEKNSSSCMISYYMNIHVVQIIQITNITFIFLFLSSFLVFSFCMLQLHMDILNQMISKLTAYSQQYNMRIQLQLSNCKLQYHKSLFVFDLFQVFSCIHYMPKLYLV